MTVNSRTWSGLGGASINRSRPVADKEEFVPKGSPISSTQVLTIPRNADQITEGFDPGVIRDKE